MKNEQLPNILYVDDEQGNLDGFKYTFRNHYNLYLTTNTDDALEIIHSNQIEVVIADQRMPGLSGTQFLKMISVSHPDIVRIILTAFTDSDSILEAINEAKVYRFLTKPWHKDDLKITINSAVEAYRLKVENNKLITDLKKSNAELTLHRDHLEELVKDRTYELEQVNEELISSNEELNAVNEELYSYKNKLEELVEKRTNERNLFFNSSIDMLLIESMDFELHQINPAVTEILGYNYTELKNMDPTELVYADDQAIFNNFRTIVKQGQAVEHQVVRMVTKNQKVIWVSWNSNPLLNEKLIFSVARDISSQKKYEIDLMAKNEELMATEEELKSTNEQLANRNEELNFAYNKLKQNQALINAVIDNIPFALWATNEKNQIIVQNKISKKYWGNMERDTKPAKYLQLNELNDWKKNYSAALNNEVINSESSLTRKNQKLILHNIVAPIKAEDKILGVLGINIDITRRKIIEENLKEQKERYRTIFENSPIGIFRSTIKGKLIEANLTFANMLGYSTSEEAIFNIHDIGKDIYFNKNKQEEFIGLLKKRQETLRDEMVFRRKNGTIFIANIYLTGIYDHADKLIFIDGIIDDITDKKKYEEEILKSNFLLEKIINSSPNIISIFDIDAHKYHFLSPRCEEILGYIKSELLLSKNPLKLIVFKEDYPKIMNYYQEAQRLVDGEKISIDTRFITKKGEIIWVNIVDQIFEQNQKGVSKTVSIISEITSRKIAEQQLIESEEKFRNIFNSSMDGIVILNKNFKVLTYNASFKELLKNHTKKLDELDFTSLLTPENVEYFKQTLSDRNIKQVSTFELELKSSTRNVFIELSCKEIIFNNSEAVLSIIRDISERKYFEREMLETVIQTEEKEREKFARNLHDDLGPLLSSIKMYMNSFESATEQKKQKFIINQVNDILKESIQTTKDISNDLSPHILTNYGLVSAIDAFISKINQHLQINFRHSIHERRYNTTIETTFYRIVKELINNTIKHAKAQNISINILEENNKLKLKYTDDGIGFDEKLVTINNIKRGMGIFNLKSRINSLNGKFIIKKVNKGICFDIETPLE